MLYIKIKDHSVSGENFELHYNEEYDLLETVPRPSLETLSKYYKSQDYISHTDTKRNLLEWVYHLVRIYTLNHKVNLIEKYSTKNSSQLLDIGCGTGNFLKQAKKSNWQATGIEPDNLARSKAQLKIGDSVYDEKHLYQLAPKSFDVITLWHVLEHLPNYEEQLKWYFQLLNLNGILVIAVPNFKSYDASFYKSNWAAYDVPRHLWHFSKTSIKKFADKYNFELIDILPMKFDAYYVSLLSEKIKDGRHNYFKALKNGYRSNRSAKQTNEYSSFTYILKKNN